MSIVLRKHIPLALVSICGLIMLLERYVTPLAGSEAYTDLTMTIQQFGMIIYSFTLGLGLATILRFHVRNVQQKRGPWYISIWLIFIVALFIGVGLSTGTTSAIYTTLWDWLMQPFGWAMGYAIFFLMYGVFYYILIKRRNQWEPMLFIIIFVFSALKLEPIGPATWIGFETIGMWIEKIPYTGGIRAWMTLMAIGTFTTGIRVLLGKETRALGVE